MWTACSFPFIARLLKFVLCVILIPAVTGNSSRCSSNLRRTSGGGPRGSLLNELMRVNNIFYIYKSFHLRFLFINVAALLQQKKKLLHKILKSPIDAV